MPILLLGALAIVLIGTGLGASALLEDRPPAARAMLGPGFWLTAGATLLLVAERARRDGLRGWWPGALLLPVLLAASAAAGAFDGLSLVVEYRGRAAQVHAALVQHLWLSAAALLLALLVSVPLGWWAFRSARAEAAIGAALGGLQVVPAIALFGFLIPLLSLVLTALPPLRAAGLGAIGATPALLGVAAYAALPLWRAVVGGLGAADPAAVEAARAMGMGEGRITAEVRLPLGLPVLIGGLRVGAVQSIGLVTLGGLVGAGGLGALVFEGMAQFAMDLILLGALPIVALALMADAALRGLEHAIEARRRRAFG